MGKAVIAIYDVRGIQSYIFKTNVVKEIIGASKIVENLIIDEFNNAVNTLVKSGQLSSDEVILDWDKQDKFQFDSNDKIKIEVLYYGGGNLVALFRTEEICQQVSILMAKNIMKKAYGLSLVYAYVDKTDNYNEDWTNLKTRLSEIKAVTPLNKPAGILPIVQYDAITGKPLSKIYDNKKVTYEAYQKLQKYKEIENEKTENKKYAYVKEFDKMRTSAEEGLIAIVHIDGNSMGMNIRNIMSTAKSYVDAVERMRKISNDIHDVFEKKAIDQVESQILGICEKHGIKATEKELPFRPLIQAGDDITFVCNERIALDIVKEYIQSIKQGYMYDEKYKFSACGGISIIHSHYPFYKGYRIAEECCKSAKQRAKNEGMTEDKQIGNFVDFEYCYSIATSNLEDSRKENYTSIDGNSLLKRPYGIYGENENLDKIHKEFDIRTFEEDLKTLKGISRSVAKLFRDTYYESEASIETALLRHGIEYNDKEDDKKDDKENKENKEKSNVAYCEINGKKYARYFDALEMMDIFGAKEENHE